MPLEELLWERDAEVVDDLSDEMICDGEADEDEVECRTPRKFSPSRQLVCDIDSALVQENYEMLELFTTHRNVYYSTQTRFI